MPYSAGDHQRAQNYRLLKRGPKNFSTATSESKTFETKLLIENASPVPITGSVGPLYGNESVKDEESIFIYVIKDISELDNLKSKLQQKNRELIETNKELESFSYSVSHDLRAPLRAIDGFGSNLLEKKAQLLDEQGIGYLKRMVTSTKRMAQLIDDLLNFSRLGRTALTKQHINLSQLAQEKGQELLENHPERNVNLVIESDLRAMADPQLMRVVFHNLLENAWKFTSHHEKAKIEFGHLQSAEGLTYFVRDDGAGFEMEYVDKLFVPFQRLHANHEFSGTGIGLALIARVIHRHGGKVWAEGEPEKGATIYFTLGNSESL